MRMQSMNSEPKNIGMNCGTTTPVSRELNVTPVPSAVYAVTLLMTK